MPKKKRRSEEKPKETPLPGEDTVICGVIRHLGGDHLIAKCLDGVDRKVRIPGKMRRRVWISEGDIILVGVWDFSPNRGDVIYKYSRSEVAKLVEKNIIPKEFLDAISELI
ncbi:MAG: translation initiation factor IF-1A [Desulfurococcales archaeon ex4484_58]|nr:MAG: translation initiation factor IF-1A [Desulfurococcales archaeon ex4484_58]